MIPIDRDVHQHRGCHQRRHIKSRNGLNMSEIYDYQINPDRGSTSLRTIVVVEITWLLRNYEWRRIIGLNPVGVLRPLELMTLHLALQRIK